MMIVQWLITHGRARYAAGAWSLPERLEMADLPATAAEVYQRTVVELSPLARLLGQVHALAIHKTLSREDYALAASETSPAELDRAITELLAQHVLASDGRVYVLTRREWSAALTASLDAAASEKRHRMLAAIYAKDEALAFEQIHHLLACGQEAAALDRLVKLIAVANPESDGVLSLTTLSTESIADVLDRALSSAERLARAPRETNEIRRSLFAISVYADEAHYFRTAAGFLAQLKHDSGLEDYETIDDAKDPGERLMRALSRAVERHNATPEAQRVYDAQGAIKGLVHYVAISIAVGARTQDAALLATLPGLLEPFAALSPLLHAMWQNAIATRETVIDNKPELARQRWLDVDTALSTVSSTELNYIGALRGAIAYGICLIEARLGIRSAEQRARALEEDPIQKVSATSLRRIARLHQGDFDGAERFRKRAEQLALLANQRQMFASTLTAELIAYALASDLTGIRQIADAIEPLGARFPGWRGYRQLAAGYFEQARGQFEAALVAFERGLALAEPDPRDRGRCFGSWPRLEAGLIETLVSLDRAAEAKAHGERALAICRDYAINVAGFPVRRALAMAEARLGDYENANRRLDEVIADLNAFGITGLELGVTYEARTRFAIWAGDKDAIEHYSRLTAREYRHGERSPLGARYERLMDESHRSGFFVLPELTDFHTKVTTSHWRSVETTLTKVRGSLAEASTSRERAECGLRLLCEAHGARSGHLFLYQAGSLELVASRGPSAPDADLQQLVARFVSQQLRSDDVATVIEDSNPTKAAHSACWLDERGAPHQFALMISEHGKSRLCAGVAVIEASAHMPVDPSARQLLVQITDELLRMGDATGITGVAL
jgi:tetratricopeptide (TPR) repeat protein